MPSLHTPPDGQGPDIRGLLAFFRSLARNPRGVGAFAPSSMGLARLMSRDLYLGPEESVIELGPGTGALTRGIIQELDNKDHYLGIELDPNLVELFQERYPGLRIVQGSAEETTKHVEEIGIQKVGAVLSGLPFASLPHKAQRGIIAQLEVLIGNGATFRTFQYVPAWFLPSAITFRRNMSRRFGPPRVTGPVVRNVPPALVLTWGQRH